MGKFSVVIMYFANAISGRIREAFLRLWEKIPMVRFYDGKWQGARYKILPIDKRPYLTIPALFPTGKHERHKSRIALPYAVGDYIWFKIRIIDSETNARRLNEFNLYVTYTDDLEKRDTYRVDESAIKGLPDNQKEYDVLYEVRYPKGTVIYSLGLPEQKGDYHKLVEAEVISILGFLLVGASLAGSVLTIIFQWLF